MIRSPRQPDRRFVIKPAGEREGHVIRKRTSGVVERTLCANVKRGRNGYTHADVTVQEAFPGFFPRQTLVN
jgi:hypothetical protein